MLKKTENSNFPLVPLFQRGRKTNYQRVRWSTDIYFKRVPFGWILLSSLFLFSSAFSTAWAAGPATAPKKPAVSLTPASGPSPSAPVSQVETPASQSETGEAPEAPFAPHWSGQLEWSYSSLPGAGSTGQTLDDFTLTGTYSLTESGDNFSIGLVGGTQVVEGIDSDYGGLNLAVGLGLGIFQPSLSYQVQQGLQALNSQTATLSLDFQLWDFLTLGPLAGAGLSSHQGPPPYATFDKVVEVDSYNWNYGGSATLSPWDFLGFTLQVQREYDTTYQFQNVQHTDVRNYNETDIISTASLTADITLFEKWSLEPSGQVGYEELPAGPVNSPVQGKTMNNASATTQSFWGYGLALMYNF